MMPSKRKARLGLSQPCLVWAWAWRSYFEELQSFGTRQSSPRPIIIINNSNSNSNSNNKNHNSLKRGKGQGIQPCFSPSGAGCCKAVSLPGCCLTITGNETGKRNLKLYPPTQKELLLQQEDGAAGLILENKHWCLAFRCLNYILKVKQEVEFEQRAFVKSIIGCP